MRSVLIALAACCAWACTDSGPAVASHFDLERFQGHWFEIARVPRDYDEQCQDTVADYRLTSPRQMQMHHSCATSTGTNQEFQATATVDEAAVPAKMTLQVGSYGGGYWVLDVDDNYDYALIGHPSRTMLWVLSRTPTLDASTYEHALSLATARGFDTTQLKKTPQSQLAH